MMNGRAFGEEAMEQPMANDPASKKARYLSAWEAALVEEKPCLGLEQLFGTRRSGNRQDAVSTISSRRQRFLDEQGNHFFSLRLEHRDGGWVHGAGQEERLLLFRSDRPGAIAKIIYSSSPAPALSNAPADEESELGSMAQAKIHVLDVKEPYRGYDLGGLLFSEAIASLKHRYMDHEHHAQVQHAMHRSLSSSVRCQLDAEEDVRRHNKLVGFYEQLGCQIKPKAKVQYLNNNDGETYRKIPMQMALRSADATQQCHRRKFLASDGSLVGRRGCFLPVQLVDASGETIHVSRQNANDSSRLDWLLVDDGDGNIQLRTTHGHYIRADPSGRCTAAVVSDDDDNAMEDTPPEDWANFRLYRVSDSRSCSDDKPQVSTHKELWMLKSPVHGTFLTGGDNIRGMHCSKSPCFWQADAETLSLVCTSDTPPRRRHYMKLWVKQTVDYVQGMHQRYLKFQLRRMSIRDALDRIKTIPCQPFQLARSSPSLRTLCFKFAEATRNAGHPDWVQLVALLHELGSVVNCIDLKTASESQDDFDWTITCRSRIVGCATPARANFHEFRCLNPDENDERYSSPQGMYELHCGLDKTLMAWTGPEYMFHMLKHNNTFIPEEGFAMLRYFALGDWHTHHEYQQLAKSEDADLQGFVAEFDQMRRDARRDCSNIDDLTDEECNRLWEEHYGNIVEKYCSEDELLW